MIDRRTTRKASRQVAARLEAVLALSDAGALTQLVADAGADSLEEWLREGLAQRVVVRCDERECVVWLLGASSPPEIIHRQRLSPATVLQSYTQAVRAGGGT